MTQEVVVERTFKTERQVQREAGLLPKIVLDTEGQSCLGWWDALEYVKAQGFVGSADFHAVKVSVSVPFDWIETNDQGGSTYWARGAGKGMLLNGWLVKPKRGWGGSYPYWRYRISDLDEAMARSEVG